MLLIMLIPALCWGADGSCVQTRLNYASAGERHLVFTCTGSTVDGSLPDTDTSAANTSFIASYKLYQIDAYPTAGGTAPDAADVFVLDEKGLDLLGSEDGGTTAYEGLNLIHASLARSALPNIYLPRGGTHANYDPFINGTLTLRVKNQSTASANYTIVLKFNK